MRNLISKYFNQSFDLSHAAFISIVVHFMLFSTQPFELFDKPLVQEKKYKEIRLKFIKKLEVVRVPQKNLEVKRPVLRKNPVLPIPVAIPVSAPIRQIESVPMQVTRATVTPIVTKAPKSVEVSTLASIQKSVFNINMTNYSAKPRTVKNVSKSNFMTASSPVGKDQVSKFVVKGVFDLNTFKPRARVDKIDWLKPGAVRHATLVDTRSVINHSFKPQVRNVAELNLDIKDQLSSEELNGLWNSYTTKVRQMIASAKIYPSGARDKRQQGKIDLSFKLGKNGEVLKLLVEHSSGHAMLDVAARDAIKNAGPFPPIPEKLNKQYVLLKLPISFVLR
jgi:TonB family protein